MPDIRLVQDKTSLIAITIDWLLQSSGALDERQALVSAVILALGTDRRAADDDILPDLDDDDRKGWWGDHEAQEIWNGWPIGTRLWLMKRSKIVGPSAREGATIARVEQYIHECLEPFITNRIASRKHVEAYRVGVSRIDADVILFRGPEALVDLRFATLWDDLGAIE